MSNNATKIIRVLSLPLLRTVKKDKLHGCSISRFPRQVNIYKFLKIICTNSLIRNSGLVLWDSDFSGGTFCKSSVNHGLLFFFDSGTFISSTQTPKDEKLIICLISDQGMGIYQYRLKMTRMQLEQTIPMTK